MDGDQLSQDEQDSIVADLVNSLGGPHLDEDEFDELYDRLDADHQAEVDDATRDFADSAVGHWSWRADD